MNTKQAAKQAAKLSKSAGQAFVVWVFDEGRDVYSAEQMRIYAPLVHIEATYAHGVQVSVETAVEV